MHIRKLIIRKSSEIVQLIKCINLFFRKQSYLFDKNTCRHLGIIHRSVMMERLNLQCFRQLMQLIRLLPRHHKSCDLDCIRMCKIIFKPELLRIVTDK